MTTNDVQAPGERSGRLTPADVHQVLFTRAGLGRRGYDEVEVDVFLEQVQQELTRLVGEKGDLRDEVARLKSQRASSAGPGGAPASDSINKEEAQLQAVRLLAAAQQTADTYVADAEKYSQRLTGDARDHSEQMMDEARAAAKRMVAEAERLAGSAAGRAVRGGGMTQDGPTRQELDDQVAYLKTFGQVVRVQLRAYLEALLRDVEEEWGRSDPGVLAPAPAADPTATGATSQAVPAVQAVPVAQDPGSAPTYEYPEPEVEQSIELPEDGDVDADGSHGRAGRRTITLRPR